MRQKSRTMQWAIIAASCVFLARGSATAAGLIGAGATFPFPVYAKWMEVYRQQAGVDISFLPVGSGAGIEQITRKQVDFGASDVPLSAEQLREAGLMQFPAVIGGVVPVINIAGIKPGELRLSGWVLGEIYLGRIRKWNDKAIAELNPSLKLPNANITIVHRADRSGTTFLWTHYLSQVSPEWKSAVGEGLAVDWPAGVGGTGNEGVASYVQRTRVSIGYVEYTYARKKNLSHVSVGNHDGEFVEPGDRGFRAAARFAEWEHVPAFDRTMTDAPGKSSWPITGASFVLLRTTAEQPQRSLQIMKFFDWALHNGGTLAEELDYTAIPEEATGSIEEAWKQVRDSSGNPVWN